MGDLNITTITSAQETDGSVALTKLVISLDDVEIAYLEEKDLEKVSAIVYECYSDAFWELFEPAAIRPPHEERVKRAAMRISPVLHEPCLHGLKATHKPTGTIIGVAVWQEPGAPGQFPTSYPAIPDTVFPSCFTPNFNRETRDVGVELGWDKKAGLSSVDIDRIWSGIAPLWGEVFRNYDKIRAEDMGERPHWLLSLLCVAPAYGRNGVGSLMTRWGMDKAREQKLKAQRDELDARFKDVCCYLESAEAATPVYTRLGFLGNSDPAKKEIMVWAP